MKNLTICILLSLFLVSCKESQNIDQDLDDSVNKTLELRNNSSIGLHHNIALENYYSTYGTDLDSVLYFNSLKDTLLYRFIDINEQMGLNINSNNEEILVSMLHTYFPNYNVELNPEENYRKLVSYQYEKLLTENMIDSNLITFIYSLSINPVDVSQLSSLINNFKNQNSIGVQEEELLTNFLDLYSASNDFWNGDPTIPAAYTSWWVRAGDAWGGIVGGVFGTAAGGPIGGIAGGMVCSQLMSGAVERSL